MVNWVLLRACFILKVTLHIAAANLFQNVGLLGRMGVCVVLAMYCNTVSPACFILSTFGKGNLCLNLSFTTYCDSDMPHWRGGDQIRLFIWKSFANCKGLWGVCCFNPLILCLYHLRRCGGTIHYQKQSLIYTGLRVTSPEEAAEPSLTLPTESSIN